MNDYARWCRLDHVYRAPFNLGSLLRSDYECLVMHTGQYEPVPTESTTELLIDDRNEPESPKLHRAHPRNLSVKKLLLFSATFVFLALLSYKIGQWSVLHRKPTSPDKDTELPVESDKDEVALPPSTNDTTGNMPGNGKYSVG